MISHFSLDQKFEQLPETPDNHYSLEADNSSTLLENNRDSIPALQEILIDITSSIVYWKGTKLRRTGKHEGTIKFKSGALLFSNNGLSGGNFVIDMHSIYIADMPEHETVPRRNLTLHLHSDFEIDKYPTAEFEIALVKYTSVTELEVNGDLTIKGITRPISTTATSDQDRMHFSTTFTFDRFEWDIGKEGSWLERKLVDRDIELKIEISISL